MTDFVIVAVATALAAASPGAQAPAAPTTAASTTALGPVFSVYGDALSCETAAALLVAPPGTRLVCLPAEPFAASAPTAY